MDIMQETGGKARILRNKMEGETGTLCLIALARALFDNAGPFDGASTYDAMEALGQGDAQHFLTGPNRILVALPKGRLCMLDAKVDDQDRDYLVVDLDFYEGPPLAELVKAANVYLEPFLVPADDHPGVAF